jgi:hypothetical protein
MNAVTEPFTSHNASDVRTVACEVIWALAHIW